MLAFSPAEISSNIKYLVLLLPGQESSHSSVSLYQLFATNKYYSAWDTLLEPSEFQRDVENMACCKHGYDHVP